jgi:hypothetical protein
MTAADLHERGLDPAHILDITSQTVPGRNRAGLAVATNDGVRICLQSRQAAGRAAAALTRVGYQVTRTDGGRRRDLLVTGWSAEALESRLEAMRSVLCQLSASPSITASAVIEQFRKLPAGSPARHNNRLLAAAYAELRGWVTDHSGIHAPHDSAIVPADTGNALRLRAVRALESAIDDLVERHLRVAAHALPLYQSLRLRTTEGQAKDTAIRRASVMYHLPATAQDSPAPGARPTHPLGPERRSPGPPFGDGLAGTTGRQAASGFPGWPLPRGPLSQPIRPETTSPAVGPRSQAPILRRPLQGQNPRRHRR